MPATTTTASAAATCVGRGQQPVEAGDAAVRDQLGTEAERVEHRDALVGHR